MLVSRVQNTTVVIFFGSFRASKKSIYILYLNQKKKKNHPVTCSTHKCTVFQKRSDQILEKYGSLYKIQPY